MISLRTRLALWSVAVLALTLLACGLIVYLTVQQALLERVDATLAGRAHSTSTYIIVAEHPPYFVQENLRKTLVNFTSSDILLQVADDRGTALAHSRAWNLGNLLPTPATLRRAGTVAPRWATTADGAFRYYVTPLYAGRDLAGYLYVAQSLEATYQTRDTLSRDLFIAGALALCVATIIMLALAQRALRPVAAITRIAQAITISRQLSQRVPYRGPADEIGQLAATFNRMLTSLDELQTAQKRFMADASHEMRTPLTSILGSAEALARRPDAPPEDRAEAIDDIIAEARRLSRLVGGLLSLARADGGQQLAPEQVRLDDLAREMVARISTAYPGTQIDVYAAAHICVWGDADRLGELITILLDNAVKYSPTSTPIICTVDSEDDDGSKGNGYGRLRVQDSGMGIGPDEHAHIFERFYRSPRGRRHDPGGSGLGLAIAAWIVEQHHGRIEVCSTEGQGTTITVLLPTADNKSTPAGETTQVAMG